MSPTRRPSSDEPVRKNETAFKVIIVLLTLVMGLAGVVVWLWQQRPVGSSFARAAGQENLIRKKFPDVDSRRSIRACARRRSTSCNATASGCANFTRPLWSSPRDR